MKKSLFKNKKGAFQLADLPGVALMFLMAGVFFAIVLVVLANLSLNTSLVANGNSAGLAVNKTITAVSEIPNNWLLLIAVIVAAAIVIGIVISNLGGATGGR